MKFNSASNLNRQTLQIKSDPRYWHLRALLSGSVNKENHSPNHFRQEFHKIKHKFQSLFTIGANKQKKVIISSESSQHKFYRTKWTQILLKNYALLTQRKSEDCFIFGWSSLYNFLFLARDQLIQAQVRLASSSFLADQCDISVVRELLQQQCQDEQLQQICRSIIPESQRGQVYLRYFSSSLQQQQFNELVTKAQQSCLFLFQIVKEDVERVCQSQQYFVFKEDIALLTKVFLIDATLLQESQIIPYKLQEKEVFPAGIVPHKLITRLLCPFFFLSEERQIVYLLFRQFFVKYFIRLISIHPKGDCMPALISKFRIQFENCLPDLHKKLLGLEVKPCKVAFQWIFHCFIGFLEVEEVLKVFDLIIGHDSLQVLVAISLGMFGLKRRRLMIAQRGKLQEVLRFEGVNVRDCLQEWENLKIDMY